MKAFGFAAAAALAVATAASADGWTRFEVIQFPALTLAGNQSASFNYVDPDNDQLIVGFSADVVFSDPTGSLSYASDLKLTFNGIGQAVGGFTNPGNILWDFDGFGSDGSGVYVDNSHTLIWKDQPISKDQLTGFTFLNDWGSSPANTWTVTLTLYKVVPAPGAMALIGLAGLVSRRRRA